jgi:hypothetical protein
MIIIHHVIYYLLIFIPPKLKLKFAFYVSVINYYSMFLLCLLPHSSFYFTMNDLNLKLVYTRLLG